jgi:tRNA (guanine37-N1)-methyltransferase
MPRLSVHVLTIFPGIIESFIKYGIVRRAIDKEIFRINVINIRDSATDRHLTVDDTPYGGGAGMIMKPDILAASLKSTDPFREGRRPPVIFLTPQGKCFNQSWANRLSLLDEFVLVCGRYRAVDERFRELYITDELSIGDYVLSGGEAAALVVIDTIVRLIPGVLNDFESGIEDSFQNGLLDCPWYTRPEIFEGIRVPEVLLSGNHAEIKKWREEQSLKRTRQRRPDLLKSRKKL